MYVCCECSGHDVDFTRAFIVVLVRHLFIHHLHLFVVCIAWGRCCLCLTANWQDQILNVFHLIICNSWSTVTLHFNLWMFATCLPVQSWAVWLFSFSPDHSPLQMHPGKRQPSTSFPNILSMSRLSQMALGHPLHSPPVSFFHRALWSLPFISCHTPRPLPPDRMALELRAWKCPSYTTSRTILI